MLRVRDRDGSGAKEERRRKRWRIKRIWRVRRG